MVKLDLELQPSPDEHLFGLTVYYVVYSVGTSWCYKYSNSILMIVLPPPSLYTSPHYLPSTHLAHPLLCCPKICAHLNKTATRTYEIQSSVVSEVLCYVNIFHKTPLHLKPSDYVRLTVKAKATLLCTDYYFKKPFQNVKLCKLYLILVLALLAVKCLVN